MLCSNGWAINLRWIQGKTIQLTSSGGKEPRTWLHKTPIYPEITLGTENRPGRARSMTRIARGRNRIVWSPWHQKSPWDGHIDVVAESGYSPWHICAHRSSSDLTKTYNRGGDVRHSDWWRGGDGERGWEGGSDMPRSGDMVAATPWQRERVRGVVAVRNRLRGGHEVHYARVNTRLEVLRQGNYPNVANIIW